MAVSPSVRSVFISICLMLSAVSFAVDEQKYTLNMQEADIKEVIDLVAKVTGKTFIIDPRVRGKVTVLSEKEMTQSQIYETFLATLEVYGFSAVEAGGITKIIGQSDIKSAGIEVETNGGRVGEEIITRVFPIQNASAMELVPILRPLVAKYGHLAGVSSANVLIVADRATNIDRLSEIVYLLDQAGSSEIEVVQLEHAWVSGMITLLERISPQAVSASNNSSSKSNTSRTVQLVGDERSNRIIVKGEKESRAQIIDLIKQLDTPTEENASYKVIFLNNADALKMESILEGIAESSSSSQNEQESAPTTPVTILADEDQNALVIRAEPNELKEIEQLISQLDIPRQQVMIEAAIVEVTGDITDALGVQWATNPESSVSSGTPFFSSSSGVVGSSVSELASSVATNVSAAGSPIGALGSVSGGTTAALIDPFGDTVDFGMIIQALQTQSNTNFLSTPSVITLDNAEAYITVGSSVPFITGGNGTEDNPYTIEREDVGTTLTVIPHVQTNGMIRLEVEQVIESVNETVNYEAQDIVTNKREVHTEVLIQDGSTIVLGGLISDQVTESQSKVPLLGSLPIIGALFRSTSMTYTKTNLLVILKPTLIADKMDSYRQSRLQGIWELRVQADDGRNLIQPSAEDIFNGNYLEGARPDQDDK